MALKSTVFRLDLQIADMERNYYAGHSLTIARHPSENDERMMVRVLAFALNATDSLAFAQSIGKNANQLAIVVDTIHQRFTIES